MANLFTTLRRKTPSKRAMLAVGGAAAITVGGISQTVDTMAAGTDSATANVSQIASQNFFPTPLVDLSCSTHYDAGAVNTAARFTWPSIAGMKYRVLVLRNNNPADVRADFFTPDTSYRYRANKAADDRVRVYTVNVASGDTDQTRVMSSGYLSWSVNASSGAYTKCVQKFTDAPNVNSWEDIATWTPAAGTHSRTQNRALDAAQRPAETATPSSSEAPSTSEAPSSSEVASSSVAPDNAPPSSASTPSTETAPERDVKIAIEAAGAARRLLVTVDGVRKCAIPLEDGDVPNVGNNQVTITNGNSLKTVDLDNCPNED